MPDASSAVRPRATRFSGVPPGTALAPVLPVPSPLHEHLVDLFRKRPTLAAEILGDLLGLALPNWITAKVEDKAFPRKVPERHTDQVVVLRDERGQPVLGIVVEIQLGRDDDKRFSWPIYVASLRGRLRVPVVVLVVCPDRLVARWAAREIALGPGFSMRPHVLGPRAIPVVTAPSVAARMPEVALLSLLAHGDGKKAQKIAEALLTAVSGFRVDDPRAALYTDLISAAAEAFKMDLTKLLPENYQPSERAKKIVGVLRRVRLEGKAEGKAEGEAEGRAEALLAFLEARGLAVSKDQRERILACREPVELDRWIRRAAAAASVEELLGRG